MRRWLTRVLVIAVAVSCGLGARSLVRSQRTFFLKPEAKGVLCFLETTGVPGQFLASFTSAHTVDRFYVYVRVVGEGPAYSLSLEGDGMTYLTKRPSRKDTSFTCGRNAPPGTYTLTVEQERGSSGVLVCVADRPVGLSGWQVLSRIFIGALLLAALWAGWSLRHRGTRQRATAIYVFKRLGTAVAFLALYLLLHEGGHALAALSFGRYDLATSDFWGWRGNPHSGLRPEVNVEPWQQAVESFAGPMLPILAAWILFGWWRSGMGRRVRTAHGLADFLSSSIVAGFLLTSIVLPGYALNLVTDSDWRGFIDNVPGPAWLARFFVLVAFVVSAMLFAKVMPHACECWRKPP